MIVLNTSLSMSCSKILKYNDGKLQNKLTFSVFGPSIQCMHIFIVNILMNKHLIIRIT